MTGYQRNKWVQAVRPKEYRNVGISKFDLSIEALRASEPIWIRLELKLRFRDDFQVKNHL